MHRGRPRGASLLVGPPCAAPVSKFDHVRVGTVDIGSDSSRLPGWIRAGDGAPNAFDRDRDSVAQQLSEEQVHGLLRGPDRDTADGILANENIAVRVPIEPDEPNDEVAVVVEDCDP